MNNFLSVSSVVRLLPVCFLFIFQTIFQSALSCREISHYLQPARIFATCQQSCKECALLANLEIFRRWAVFSGLVMHTYISLGINE